MDENGRKRYVLYAMPLTAESIELASKERFSRATPTPEPGYVLLYTDGQGPDGAREINKDNAGLLTQADVRWLTDCGAAILAEEIERRKPEILAELSDSVERLGDELRRRRSETERGD